MGFVWDPNKDQLNRKKHEGLDFETAKLVFEDPNVVLEMDRIEESGEERWHAIGMVKEALLLVAHVYRTSDNNEQVIRIFSARKANSRECRKYFQQ